MHDESKSSNNIFATCFNHSLLYYPFIFVEKNLAAMACKCALKGLQFSIRVKNYLHMSLAGTFRKSKAKAISVSCS